MKIKSIMSVAVISTSFGLASPVLAGGNDGHHHGHADQMSGDGHMMNQNGMGQYGENMDSHMREVMGHGRVNKVMAEHGMLNIKHEPMPEMNWPQMSMNFRTQKQVDLSKLKPGQQVDFKLLVDDDNNYVIKEIIVK